MVFSSVKLVVGFLFGLAINVVLSTVKQGRENLLAKLLSLGFTSAKYKVARKHCWCICQMVTILIPMSVLAAL